jgi:hypothetical protein
METIKEYLKDNKTLKAMLLKVEDVSFKTGALEQIRLDTNLSKSFIIENYFNILSICK